MYVLPCQKTSVSYWSDTFRFHMGSWRSAPWMSSLNNIWLNVGPHDQSLLHFSPLLLIQTWLSLRSQCAWGQCCDQKQHTGSPQCWPVWAAVRRGRAGKQRPDVPSPAAGCTLSPADRPLPSGAPRNRTLRRPSEDGSAPDGFKRKTFNHLN